MKLFRLTALFITAALAIFLAGCSFGSSAGGFFADISGDILINEVVSSNSVSLQAERFGSPDWVELYNNTDSDINLEGYVLERTDSEGKACVFPSVIIPSRGYTVVLCTESNIHSEDYTVSGFRLPKEGTSLALIDSEGATVNAVSVPKLDTDISFCVNEGRYMYCMTPTPGSENKGLFFDDIEAALEGTDRQALAINEANHDFAELYNRGSESIQLAMFCLSDDESNLSKYRLPERQLAPGEYYVVYFGPGEGNAGFSLNEYESNIFLSCADTVVDSIDIYGAVGGISVGKLADGKQVYFAAATPGQANSDVYSDSIDITDMDESSPVRISEILVKNSNSLIDESGDRPSWVEVHNYSDSPVGLGSYYLTDNENNLFKWQLPDTELAPGGYMIFYLEAGESNLCTGFGIGQGESLTLLDMGRAESQKVFVPDESRLADISYGEKDGGWLYFGKPTPGRANTSAGSESITNAEKIDRSQVFINEVAAVSAVRSGGKDWIELYNPSDTAVSLDGIYLSDDDRNLKKYSLSGSMEPGSYLVIDASSKVKEQGENTAPFGISAAGETLYLTDDVGCVVDSMDTGVLGASYTSGRAAGDYSGERVFLSQPTKGSENSQVTGRKLNSPVFSVDGGIVNSPSVTVEISGEGTIYYTLDGSLPDMSSAVYSGPVILNESTCISAFCCSDGHISSDMISQTYIFDEAHTVPVVCLSLSSSDLAAVSSSIDKNNIIERRCYVEYYSESGEPGTSFPAGLRIGGAGTRGYAQKTFQIYLRGGYGQSSVVYPFFENYPITEFKSLVLRAEGQDNSKTRFRDIYSGMLFDFMDIDNQQGRFVCVYINGKYWGLYDLKENQNEDYFASRTGLDAGQITMIRRNEKALSGSNAQILDVYSKARSWNMADDEKYAAFSELVDTGCFIDHIIARGYTGDFDMFNQKYAYADDYLMKVRPTFFDCDFAFPSVYANVISKYFSGEGIPSNDGTLSNMYIPTALKKNASWREDFIQRTAEVMKVLPSRSLELFDEMYEEMKPEMQRHISRWHTPSGMGAWESNMKNLRSILEKRPKAFLGEFSGCFGVSSERMHELFPEYY